MSPPKDPTKVLTDQEKFSNSLVGNLPFVIAFFSLNVPSGLAVYWIINNLLTTGITLVVKSQLKDEAMPTEVAQMMAEVDTPVRQTTRKKTTSSGKSELKEITKTPVMDWEEKKVKESGFGSTIDTSIEEGEVGEDEVEKEEEVEKVDTTAADEEKKRKKRAASRKGKKKA
jgi:membrane protein insertase Oxa1/YidC/SpoIIIJ